MVMGGPFTMGGKALRVTVGTVLVVLDEVGSGRTGSGPLPQPQLATPNTSTAINTRDRFLRGLSDRHGNAHTGGEVGDAARSGHSVSVLVECPVSSM